MPKKASRSLFLASVLMGLSAIFFKDEGASMNSVAHTKEQLRRQYFKSWASYPIPMRPVDPIDFKETESLNAFYLAYYDDSSRLVRFVKYLVDREEIEEKRLNNSLSANAFHYFEAVPSRDNEYKWAPGRAIEYCQVESLGRYIKATVSHSGAFAHLVLIVHHIVFTDDYSYWPNGKLRARVQTKQDGTTIRSSYNEAGNEI